MTPLDNTVNTVAAPGPVETAPVWLWDAPHEPIRAAHQGSTQADILVVGAGIAGLATAYHLAARDQGLRVVVAEATQVGYGATGRSTGIVGPGLSTPLRGLRRRYGDEVTRAAFASSQQGVADLSRLLEATGIDCDARAEDHVVAALTPGQERRVRQHVTDLADLGFPVRWWDADAARRRLGADYRCAFSYEDVLLVDPYRLVTGLARAAEALGVRILERTPVTGWEHRSGRVLARTPGGVVDAGRVLLTVDGYAGRLNPHPASVLPVRTHVVATRPLTGAERAGLGWDGVGGVIDQRNYFDYLRLGAGDRLLFGGARVLFPTGDPRRDALASGTVFAEIERRLRARFPMLRDVPVEARWSGLTGGTLDRLPVVGSVPGQPRVDYAGGWCGHGLALCLDTARRYAEAVTAGGRGSGARGRLLPASAGGPRLPWMRRSTVGLPSVSVGRAALPAYLRALDWQDRLLARPPAPLTTPGDPAPVDKEPPITRRELTRSTR